MHRPIQTIPDLLPPQTFAYAQGRFLDPAVHWYYLPFTATPEDDQNVPEYAGSLSHLIWKDDQAISPLWDVACHILLTACDRTGEQLESVTRVRLGLATRTPYAIQHTPHVDHNFKHRTGIWYPHSSSGDTVVFNEKRKQRDPSKYTELHRQTPTGNLWFDFDGEHYHSSTTPHANEQRLVLTINYILKK
jgi:hypothetical protein